jgi:hypothetical protein
MQIREGLLRAVLRLVLLSAVLAVKLGLDNNARFVVIGACVFGFIAMGGLLMMHMRPH